MWPLDILVVVQADFRGYNHILLAFLFVYTVAKSPCFSQSAVLVLTHTIVVGGVVRKTKVRRVQAPNATLSLFACCFEQKRKLILFFLLTLTL